MSKSTNNILTHIAAKSLIKEYALFLQIKRLHKNSVIYKPKKLHEKLKCSRTKSNRIVAIIIREGWGYYHNSNLVLKSVKNVHLLYNDFNPKNKLEINSEDDIYLELLKNKLRQKKYIESKISDLKSCSSKVVKSALKVLKGEKKVTDFGTSVKTIAKLFNVSVASASRITKRLAKNGLIFIQKRFDNFGVYDKPKFIALQSIHKGIFVNRYGFISKRLSSIITLS